MSHRYEIPLICVGLVLILELAIIGFTIMGIVFNDPKMDTCTNTTITVTDKSPDYQWIAGDNVAGYYYYINEPGAIVYDEILTGVTYDTSYCVYNHDNYIKTIQRQSCIFDDTGTCR